VKLIKFITMFGLFIGQAAFADSGKSACSQFGTDLQTDCLSATSQNPTADNSTVAVCTQFKGGIQRSCLSAVKANQNIGINTLRACLIFPTELQKRCLDLSTGPNSKPDFNAITSCRSFPYIDLAYTCMEAVKFTPGVSANDLNGCAEAKTAGKATSCLRGLCPSHGLLGGCTTPSTTASKTVNSNSAGKAAW
jgi:hypothetical protein